MDQADVIEVFVSGEASRCQKVGEVKRCQGLSFGYREIESFSPRVVEQAFDGAAIADGGDEAAKVVA